MNITWFYCL